MSQAQTDFSRSLEIELPVICGAMYPCSNPELVAAASEAGGIGIIQPISIIYAHGQDLREGIQLIRKLTDKPIGFNAIVEKSSKAYEDRMRAWIDVALEEGVRFFITALGNPNWVCEKVHALGGLVYHDITERKWAEKAIAAGVDGLICVNSRAGGHAGGKTPEELYDELKDLGVPLICAGGIGGPERYTQAMKLGYSGVQLGTRFIAAKECHAHKDYKDAIVRAQAEDIVLTEKISGVPVAVIKTPYIERVGTRAGFLMKRALRHPKLKHYARMYYSLKSVWQLKRANAQGMSYKDYFQAGKSVDEIDKVETTAEIMQHFRAAHEEL